MMRPYLPARMCGTQAALHSADAHDVHIHHLAPFRDRDLLERLELERAEDRRVVHQDVDPGRRPSSFSAAIRPASPSAATSTCRPSVLRRSLRELGGRRDRIPDIRDDHRGAVLGEAPRQHLADAAARAGDDRHLALQPFHTTSS
jgi:hypothetical protein